jgi:hypothetical protein
MRQDRKEKNLAAEKAISKHGKECKYMKTPDVGKDSLV